MTMDHKNSQEDALSPEIQGRKIGEKGNKFQGEKKIYFVTRAKGARQTRSKNICGIH